MKRGIAVLACIAVAASIAWAGDPEWYVRKGTWRATLLAARESIAKLPVQVGRAMPDFGQDDYTITCWIKTVKGGTILAKAPPAGEWAPNGKTWFVGGGKLGYDIGWVGAVTSRQGVADDRWHHVAVSGPGELRFFVDGKADFQGHLSGKPDEASHVVKIGSTSSDFPSPSHFDGLMDDLRVFRRRLSQAEVAAVGEGKDATGAVAVWTRRRRSSWIFAPPAGLPL